MRVIKSYRIILLFLIIKDMFRQSFCETYNMIKIKGVIMGSSTRNSYKRSDKIIKQGIENGIVNEEGAGLGELLATLLFPKNGQSKIFNKRFLPTIEQEEDRLLLRKGFIFKASVMKISHLLYGVLL